MLNINHTLMYVTDDNIKDDTLFFNCLESALKGGANCIQLREKYSSTLTFYNRALKAKAMCETYNIPLIINDRLDIALAINADGIHIGQQDMPYAIVRKLLGKDKIIGLSVSNKKQALVANTLNVNYIGLSPVFTTATKTKDLAKPLGINGLKHIKTISNKPIICIGGITINNTPELLQHGANGIAVVTAISKAKNPETATKKLKKIICKTGLTK